MGFSSLSKIGRVAVRWSRPLEGTPKTVTIRMRRTAGTSVSRAPMSRLAPLQLTGQETGIDLGLESFATLADGTMIHNPRCYRRAERRLKTAQRRVSRRKKGSNRRKKAVQLLAKAHQTVRRQRQDFHHKAALQLVRDTRRSSTKTCRSPTWCKNHHLAKSIADAGWARS